jgi:hypothetical protein
VLQFGPSRRPLSLRRVDRLHYRRRVHARFDRRLMPPQPRLSISQPLLHDVTTDARLSLLRADQRGN